MLLALDTATDITSIALASEGELVAELTWHAGKNHTVELIPNLLHLLCQARATTKDISAIAVAKGPGSFNGLRVGMSTAKGLAYSLGVPLVGVSTLEVEAFPHRTTPLPICPILNAGRGEVATALFQMRRGRWCRLVAEHITTVDLLGGETGARTLFCGEVSPELASQLRRHLGRQAVIIEGAALRRRAGYLAELGWRKLRAGEQDNPATLQPLYLRKPAITKPRAQKEAG